MPVYTTSRPRPENREDKDQEKSPHLPPRTLQYLATRVEVGARDNELFAAACQFRDAGFSQAEAEAQLIPCGVRDGLSEEYARRRIKSAYSREARDPIENKNGSFRDSESCSDSSNGAAKNASNATKKEPGNTPWPAPEPLPEPIKEGTRLFIEAYFAEKERIAIGQGYLGHDGDIAIDRGVTIPRKSLLEDLLSKTLPELYPSKEGIFVRVNPMQMKGDADKDVSAHRYALAEFDLDKKGNRIPKEIQFAILVHSGFPIRAIIDSGNKSLQGLVQVDAKDRAEFDARWAEIEAYFSQFDGFDPKNKNPSRYCRLPGAIRTLYNGKGEVAGTGQQTLLALRIGPGSWAEWEKEHAESDYSDEELLEIAKAQLTRYRNKERLFPLEMGKDAFYGIAGEIVEIIAPVSEACKEAILAQFLVGFGNLVGRSATRKQAAVHHLNEFTVLVGPTARGRKGTAWRAVQALLAQLDQEWLATRVKDGLQSGEAIIHAVRDEITGPIPMHKRKAG